MRMMMKVSIPVETGNAAAKAGALGSQIEKAVANMQPEAAYFYEEDGERTGFIVFDMQDSSDIPAVAEPWFLAFNAKLTIRPVMTAADLARGPPGVEGPVGARGGGAWGGGPGVGAASAGGRGGVSLPTPAALIPGSPCA